MKTPEELGLTQRTYDALIAVRDKLADGRFRHLTESETTEVRKDDNFDGVFNMNTVYDKAKCGTVGCIGGWMAIQLGGREFVDPLMTFDLPSLEARSSSAAARAKELWVPQGTYALNPLRSLFYPGVDSDLWDAITPAQAVEAIDYYLETGDAVKAWQVVMETDEDGEPL